MENGSFSDLQVKILKKVIIFFYQTILHGISEAVSFCFYIAIARAFPFWLSAGMCSQGQKDLRIRPIGTPRRLYSESVKSELGTSSTINFSNGKDANKLAKQKTKIIYIM